MIAKNREKRNKIDDFSDYEKIWQKNRMVADGADTKSQSFRAGFNFGKCEAQMEAWDEIYRKQEPLNERMD